MVMKKGRFISQVNVYFLSDQANLRLFMPLINISIYGWYLDLDLLPKFNIYLYFYIYYMPSIYV